MNDSIKKENRNLLNYTASYKSDPEQNPKKYLQEINKTKEEKADDSNIKCDK